MTAFYNEIDPYAAQWLRNLIAAGHIAPGIVDERPIQEIEPWELHGFTQCHFFAGIGIWSLALRRAGWSDDWPIWTGSCPCQPFSNAGKRKGKDDERHLWPYWFDLVRECKPSIVVGEQVASKDGLGWFDLVSADMEGADYAVAAADLCAAGFRQAHIRQRLYFVALADTCQQSGERDTGKILTTQTGQHGAGIAINGSINLGYSNGRDVDGLAHHHQGREGWAGMPECGDQFVARARSLDGGMADSDRENQSGRGILGSRQSDDASLRAARERSSGLRKASTMGRAIRNPGEIDERWLAVDWLLCRNPSGEPSWRPVEPGSFPLAHGIAARMGKLRAYGNGLDLETATKFCEVVTEICTGV